MGYEHPSFNPPLGAPFTRKELTVTGAATDTVLWAAPTTPNCIYLVGVWGSVSAACTLSITDGNDGSGTRLYYVDLPGAGTFSVVFTENKPYRLTVATALKITNSAGNVKVQAYGFETTPPGK